MKRKEIRLAILCLTISLLSVGQSQKQTISSSVLGEQRELLIYSPAHLTNKLPLILVFDGGGLFDVTVSAVRFMNYYSEIPQMPEAIVVGIQNTDRNRDIPIPQEYEKGKGEVNFMRFVRDELIPGLEKKYPLNGHVISIGHSQGGFFVSYLLSRDPSHFPWIIALDAPMNVEEKSLPMKQQLAKLIHDPKNKIRYSSVEAAYGWEKEWDKFISPTDPAKQEKLAEESHESMAFHGVYEGLKYLYHDFPPVKKDANLSELQSHYDKVEAKYGYPYEIPFRVLMASASRKIAENRKAEINELLDYAEPRYGPDEAIRSLRDKASKLSGNANSIIDSLLNLPKPSIEQVKKFEGTWKGQLISKEGKSFEYSIEISTLDAVVKMLCPAIPTDPTKRTEPDFFHITRDEKLIFGYKNRGGGIILNTLQLDAAGILSGEGWWLGFTIPADVPEDGRNQLNFLLKTPTRFTGLKR